MTMPSLISRSENPGLALALGLVGPHSVRPLFGRSVSDVSAHSTHVMLSKVERTAARCAALRAPDLDPRDLAPAPAPGFVKIDRIA